MSLISGFTTQRRLYIGCAGWSFARANVPDVPEEGSQLEKYSGIFKAVEINSSFHRSHRTSTYERWAESVPQAFKF